MMGNYFDALLGKFYNNAVEVELGAGVECKSGVAAAKNASTRRIDITADCPYVYRSGYTYQGASTAVATGAGTVALALNSTATTIALGGFLSAGSAVEIRARVWVSRTNGQVLYRDEIAFAVYRETASSEVHLLKLGATGADQIGTGTQTLAITGVNSNLAYSVTAAYSGSLGIAIAQDGAIARNARADLWLSETIAIPVA